MYARRAGGVRWLVKGPLSVCPTSRWCGASEEETRAAVDSPFSPLLLLFELWKNFRIEEARPDEPLFLPLCFFFSEEVGSPFEEEFFRKEGREFEPSDFPRLLSPV